MHDEGRAGPLSRIGAGVRAAADAVETAPVGPGVWVAGFLAIVALRHLLELLSGRLPVYRPAAFLVHYPLAYLAPALTLALLLSLLSASPVRRVTRLMLPASALLLLPPLVDLALPALAALPFLPDGPASSLEGLTSGRGAIGYLYGLGLGETLTTFLDPRQAFEGTTAGIRVEALIACLAGGLYVALRGARWWRAILALPAVYVTAIVFFTLPTRFMELLRLGLPGLSVETLYGADGLLPGPGDLHDGVSTIYLTLLILAVLLAWTARDGGRASLASGPGSLAWGRGLLAGSVAAVGIAAAVVTRSGLAVGVMLSPYDRLAIAATLLGATLVVAGVRAPTPGRPVPLVAMAGGLCLAVGAGYAALAGMLALTGTAWLVGPVVRSLGWRHAEATGGGLLGLAAVAAGYLSLAGDSGLVWIPGGLLLAGFLTGLGGGLAAAASRRAWRAGLGVAAALVPVLAWPLVLAPPAPTVAIIGLFFGGAALAARMGLPEGTEGVLRGALATLASAAAGLCLVSPHVQDDLTRAVMSRASYHLELGDEALEAERFKEAESAFRVAATLDPGAAEPHARLGLVDLGRARVVTEAASLPWLRSRAEAREDLDAERRKRLMAGMEHLRRALEKDPSHVPAAYNLGLAHLMLGDCADAVERLDQALASRPGHAGALFERAEALECLGRPVEAIAAYELYVERTARDPGQAGGHRQAREKIRILSRGAAGTSPADRPPGGTTPDQADQ